MNFEPCAPGSQPLSSQQGWLLTATNSGADHDSQLVGLDPTEYRTSDEGEQRNGDAAEGENVNGVRNAKAATPTPRNGRDGVVAGYASYTLRPRADTTLCLDWSDPTQMPTQPCAGASAAAVAAAAGRTTTLAGGGTEDAVATAQTNQTWNISSAGLRGQSGSFVRAAGLSGISLAYESQ